MRKDWEVKKLGDICEIQNGYAFRSALFREQGLPILRISNIQNDAVTLDNIVYFLESDYNIDLDRFKVYPGDIVIALSGATTGKIGINKTDLTFYLNQRVALCRESNTLIKGYLFYYLRTKTMELLSMAGGVAQPNLSTNQIQQLLISVPTLQIQQQVVEELDCLTSIIEKQKKQFEELDNLAQSIFYDMFGDPIENEKGWNIHKFNDFIEKNLIGIIRSSKEQDINNDYLYFKMNNISVNGYVDLSKVTRINATKEEIYKFTINDGDFLFNTRNSYELVGKSCVYRAIRNEKAVLSNNILKMTFKEGLNSIYLSFIFKTSYIKDQLEKIKKGTTNVAAIYYRDLSNIKILIPPLSLQQQFAAKIEAIEKQKELIKKSIKETEDLFNSRMDYYFN